MRYTKWIQDNLPMYQGATTAETYALIQRARKSSLVWTVGTKVFMIVIALRSVDYFGPTYGIVPFQGLSGWLVTAFALSMAFLASRQIEHVILTKRIRKLASAA